MLKELKFVQGAVAKKELLPALTHFRIEDGHVRSFNGSLALSSPIQFDINCTPRAIPFVKAIQNCKDTVTLKITPAGRLSVKSGPFKAFIQCIDEETPHVEPEGEFFEIDGEALLKALKTLLPFVGSDASRPWCNGVLLSGQSAYATNNVVLIEYWIGNSFPLKWNIPSPAIKEMVRINEAPINAQADENSITFHYEDGRWVRSALYSTEWPDLEKVLSAQCAVEAIDERIFEAIEVIKPFGDKLGRMYVHGEKIATSLDEDDSASYTIEGFNQEGVYQMENMYLLKGVANSIDFKLYPKPCIFYGENLRGAIIGMRT